MNIQKSRKSTSIVVMSTTVFTFFLIAKMLSVADKSSVVLLDDENDISSEARMFKVSFEINLDGITHQPVLISQENTTTDIKIAGETGDWKINYILQPVYLGDEVIAAMVNMNIQRGSESISQPELFVSIDEAASIEINHEKLPASGLTISLQTSLHQP